MLTNEERWSVFVDYAAVIHDLMTDAQTQIAAASLEEPITPEAIDQLSKTWFRLEHSFRLFTIVSKNIGKLPQLSPQQVRMATAAIKKINKAARETDATLRAFFQLTGLSSPYDSHW